MKSQKMLYLDDDIKDQLNKVPNASALVERLLTEHFNKLTDPNESYKETQELIESKTKELANISKKIEEIKAKREAIIEKELNNKDPTDDEKIINRRKQIIDGTINNWIIPEKDKKEIANILFDKWGIIRPVELFTERGYERKPDKRLKC